MVNKPRAIGTRAESLVVDWAKNNGFPDAHRLGLHGNRDKGDILLTRGIIAEVKAHKDWSPSDVNAWLDQTATEVDNWRQAENMMEGILILKRPGTLDVGRWWVIRREPCWGRHIVTWMSVADYWWLRGWSRTNGPRMTHDPV